MTHPQVRPDPAFGLLELYDAALPHVYGYLLGRCGDVSLAEELTAESLLAAVHAVRKPGAPDPSIPWLIGVRPAQARRPLAAGGQADEPVRRPFGLAGPVRRRPGRDVRPLAAGRLTPELLGQGSLTGPG